MHGYIISKKNTIKRSKLVSSRAILQPDFIENEWLFFLNYAKLGEGEKAVQMLQTIAKRYPGAEHYVDEIREAYNKSGINGLFTWLVDVNKNKPIPVQG